MSPWVDLEMQNPEMVAMDRADPVLIRSELVKSAAEYAGAESLRNPLVSPVFGPVDGLPPVIVHTGDAESLLPDIQLWVDACQQAGVTITSHVVPGGFHAFSIMSGFLPEAKAGVREQSEFVHAYLKV